jgi:hypothetical protein
MRGIIDAGRQDRCRVFLVDFIACPPANARLQYCDYMRPLPADWTIEYCPHHPAIKPWQLLVKLESRQNWAEPKRPTSLLDPVCKIAPVN